MHGRSSPTCWTATQLPPPSWTPDRMSWSNSSLRCRAATRPRRCAQPWPTTRRGGHHRWRQRLRSSDGRGRPPVRSRSLAVTTTSLETGWRTRVNRGPEHGPPLVAGGIGALTAVNRHTLRPNGPLAGVALRYGFFYGPGTWFHSDGDVAAQLHAGRYPVLGTGAGRWSFVHIDDTVAATVATVESDRTGAFNICDDNPVPPRSVAAHVRQIPRRAVAAVRADRSRHGSG